MKQRYIQVQMERTEYLETVDRVIILILIVIRPLLSMAEPEEHTDPNHCKNTNDNSSNSTGAESIFLVFWDVDSDGGASL
mmetsp:Transcript_23356/g.26501  ORF Transcript_23356/g.26501 Transcript_23356/m.26501 type:complete len:80 (-) Transcript_23356:2426-2665(-)